MNNKKGKCNKCGMSSTNGKECNNIGDLSKIKIDLEKLKKPLLYKQDCAITKDNINKLSKINIDNNDESRIEGYTMRLNILSDIDSLLGVSPNLLIQNKFKYESCETCIKKRVCKYMEKTKELLSIINKYNGPCKISLECKEYFREM